MTVPSVEETRQVELSQDQRKLLAPDEQVLAVFERRLPKYWVALIAVFLLPWIQASYSDRSAHVALVGTVAVSIGLGFGWVWRRISGKQRAGPFPLVVTDRALICPAALRLRYDQVRDFRPGARWRLRIEGDLAANALIVHNLRDKPRDVAAKIASMIGWSSKSGTVG